MQPYRKSRSMTRLSRPFGLAPLPSNDCSTSSLALSWAGLPSAATGAAAAAAAALALAFLPSSSLFFLSLSSLLPLNHLQLLDDLADDTLAESSSFLPFLSSNARSYFS